ncbi:methionine gamma-lyase [Labrys miyagiensis]|uniref:Methionine gamma-lyase n=1 Tax=Labrys miyagiensis TaxID=346912 RepID=A0ABQ6CQV4_9HYPH|nr:aminotransferase class I/II-fold pyridoxal phosphate-dependent enzyme [Labrys miyagiensis]GLS22741.1 methionine gamma-lyase [Labrys miyagiensis]
MQRKSNRRQGPSTRAIHLGYDPATANGALTPPVYMTSTYAFESVEQGTEIFEGKREGYIYGRTKNPTQGLLEERVADLEGAEAGLVVSSGMGAISATLWTLLKAGDRVVADKILYGNTFALLTKGLTKFGVSVELVDFGDLQAVARAAAGARVVYFETPANPNLRVIDIAAVTGIARRAGALSIVDNTFATPILQRPLELGADLVVHSATKYLGGHGDLLAGVVVGKAADIHAIRMNGLRYLTGAAVSPLTAFLVLRGLKTLELRVLQHSRSALAIAELLAEHPGIASLSYPGLPGSPGHAVAKGQMSAGGGLIAFELKGGYQAGVAFMNALEIASRAVSLGDAETLVQHPASMTHAAYGAEERLRHGISDSLIRLSVGLENIEDLIDDIEAALSAVPSEVAR